MLAINRYLAAGGAFVLAVVPLLAGGGVIVSARAPQDAPPSADPASSFWRGAKAVFATGDTMGQPVPGHRTEIRSRWTPDYLYILFICPYRELYGEPQPVTDKETNKLWSYDVAEAFIGWDYKNTHRYKEFEISPHGEWVDLDIDRDHPLPGAGVSWNSGFKVKTRIDPSAKIWYGEMQIPWKSIDERQPKPGNELRVNFYRMQGPPPDRKKIAWQPTNAASYHVPEAFGTLRLE